MSSVWHITEWELVLRLLAAMVLGGFIGWEREYSNHSAGLRTHILVCVGSTLIMLLSIYGFSAFAHEINVRMDPARLAAQVISGIGFLGAGTIMRNGLTISGLTTAASLWVVAAIGLSVGAGFYIAACAVTIIVFLCLWILNRVEKRFISTEKWFRLSVTAAHGSNAIQRIVPLIREQGWNVRKMSLGGRPPQGSVLIHYWVSGLKHGGLVSLLDKLNAYEGICGVEAVECGKNGKTDNRNAFGKPFKHGPSV